MMGIKWPSWDYIRCSKEEPCQGSQILETVRRLNQHTKELISARNTLHKYNTFDSA